jgi:hypothetical protein
MRLVRKGAWGVGKRNRHFAVIGTSFVIVVGF